VNAGDLFFAVRGERLDGHDYVAAAFERGSQAAVVSRARVAGLPDGVLARPLLIVTEFSVRLPADATSKMRNVGVPDALDRAMVAPLPWMVTFPVISGRPTPPLSAVLLMAVSEYVQPLVRVTVPFVVLASVMAEIRAEAVQGVAANAGDATTTLPAAPPMSTAAPAVRRRAQLAERLASFRSP